MEIEGVSGLYQVKAQLRNASGHLCAEGKDEVLGIYWDKKQLKGKGALYGTPDDPVATFYQKATGCELPAFHSDIEKLDWIVVTRSSLDAPQPVPVEAFCQKEGKSVLELSLYKDDDLRTLAGVTQDNKIDRTFADGAQPDPLLPANQSFQLSGMGN